MENDCGLLTFNPELLLGDRLDIVLYTFCAEQFLFDGDVAKAEALYDKFLSHFPNESKEHSFDNFRELAASIREKGFDPYCPVVVNPKLFFLENGSHRCAISIALGIKSIPYSMTFLNNCVAYEKYTKIFSSNELDFLFQLQTQYVQRIEDGNRVACLMRTHVLKNQKDFNSLFSSLNVANATLFYQGDKSKNISGKRDCRGRFERYGLQKFLNNADVALEFGCNIGIFSSIVAANISKLYGYDINETYIKLARKYSSEIGVDNTVFNVGDVKNVKPERKFSVIISCAVHGWSGLSFSDYCRVLLSHAEKGAIILFESHEILSDTQWRQKKNVLLSFCDCLQSGFIDDIDHSLYSSEIREFLILKVKNNPVVPNEPCDEVCQTSLSSKIVNKIKMHIPQSIKEIIKKFFWRYC